MYDYKLLYDNYSVSIVLTVIIAFEVGIQNVFIYSFNRLKNRHRFVEMTVPLFIMVVIDARSYFFSIAPTLVVNRPDNNDTDHEYTQNPLHDT